MKIYLVGGAIRDSLLGIANEKTENDYVVVGSDINEMLSLGYKQVGKNFPVFLHPKTKEEYALARKEKKVAPGYSGFKFDTLANITIEEDLYRRDLTINAIAKDNKGNLIDPFGGLNDIKSRTIRHISDAFVEDPVRILRIARFATRFDSFGFKIAPKTKDIISKMALSGELNSLVGERVFKELSLALSYQDPDIFFAVLNDCGALNKIFPAFDINNAQPISSVDIKNATVVTRFAIWLHKQKLANIKSICENMRCPKKYQQLAQFSANWHLFAKDFAQHSPEEILNFIISVDAIRQKDRFIQLLNIFKCLGIEINIIEKLLAQINSININKLAKNNIVEELYKKRLIVIRDFFNST